MKTIYESAHTEYLNLDYLSEYLPQKAIQKYLIERSFLQTVLGRLIDELNIRCNTPIERFKTIFVSETTLHSTRKKINRLKNEIEDNEAIKEIEIPIIKNISVTRRAGETETAEITKGSNWSLSGGASVDGLTGNASYSTAKQAAIEATQAAEIEEDFSSVFMKVFQIKNLIEKIKEILVDLGVKHIVVLLDDFSEIDDFAIKTFVDVILAPLNNWSDEFIKFKVAAYPDRIYYEKIDPGKIDVINLDFYNLYSEFDRNRMEEGAVDFTKRLLEKRFNYYTQKSPDIFFDTQRMPMADYYELIFQVSMNVPRIIGYILSYCYQSKIIYDRQISRQDIEAAAQKYYEDKIESFFHKTTYSILSLNEKIDTLQLKSLLQKFVEKMIDTKRKISTGDYSGELYNPSAPYASHFYFDASLEKFIKTLELNFFVSKYMELSDKDGLLSSVYCLNYGLAQKHNLLWGKPRGTKYRKYFNQRPFGFNVLLKDFLASSKTTRCSNEECAQVFSQEQMTFLEFLNYKCNKCGADVKTEPLSEELTDELQKIEKSSLLNPIDIDIVMELSRHEAPITAKEISEEIDVSSQSIGQKCKMLDLKKGLILRGKSSNPYTYKLSPTAKVLYK